MMHHTLSVILDKNTSRGLSKASREKQITACGGLRHINTDHQKAARMISKLYWVERVVVTCVKETSVGVWRNGRKS